MIPSKLVDDICAIEQCSVRRNVSLAEISRWKVGGTASCIVEPNTVAALESVLNKVNIYNAPYVIIGSTSNLLFSDKGLNVLTIQIGKSLEKVEFKGNELYALSGIWVPKLARIAAQNGFSGFEHISGIPGTLGGLVCMNGGSQRKGISEYLNYVDILANGESLTRVEKSECEFDYRTSKFQNSGDIIVGASFSLPRGSYKDIRKEMLGILSSRRKKFPNKLPNCGSVFVSNPKMYEEYGTPGAVIEKCDLKGTIVGGASISNLHANFIVNLGGASSNDILKLIHLMRSEVAAKTGYLMSSEVRFVTPEGDILPAHEYLDAKSV